MARLARVRLGGAVGEHLGPVEVVLQVLIGAGLLYALGIPLWVEGARAIVFNPLTMIQHANVAFPRGLDRWLGWLVVTPAVHRLHHAADRRFADSNYGVVFSFWDRLFGSRTEPHSAVVARYGVPPLDGERWQTVAGMMATPVLAPAAGVL